MEEELESIILLPSDPIHQHRVFIWEDLHTRVVVVVDIEEAEEDMTAEIMVDIVEVVVVVAMTDIDALLRTTGEMITGEDPDLGLIHHAAVKTPTTTKHGISNGIVYASSSIEWIFKYV